MRDDIISAILVSCYDLNNYIDIAFMLKVRNHGLCVRAWEDCA